MSGDEQKIFYATMDYIGDRHTIKQVSEVFRLYQFVTGRKWHDDYYNWYLPMLDESHSYDAGKQGQGQGKETSQ